MRTALLSLFFVAMLSCRKEQKLIYDFAKFRGRYLVCDSIKTTRGGSEITTVLGRGKGSDAKFDTTKQYTVYSTPPQTYGYRDDKSPKIYYWQGSDRHEGDYLIIREISGDHVILEHKNIRTDENILYYYTAD